MSPYINMRVKRIAGLTAVWLGGTMAIRSASTTGFSLSLEFLGSVLGGLLVLFSGMWLIARGEKLPEDTGESLVPRRWIWYATSIFFALGAVFYTGELLGIVIF